MWQRAVRASSMGALVGILVVACASSPLGRKQLILLPAGQMEQMGIAAYSEMKTKQPLEKDPAKEKYVECVARAITAELGGQYKGKQWEVTVFKDKAPNAFALPGGKIGVHSGMLKTAKTPDQLAAVLGHEVGHVIARHGNERVSANLASQAGLQVAAVMAGSSAKKQAALAALGVGVQVGVLLPYSRTHESEADLIGVDLMAKAGFDPRESVKLWENMAKDAGKSPPEFLSTHPGHETRIKQLKKRMPHALKLFEQAKAQGKHPNCHL
ncbi:MAG: M48 family metallopeptidase [bacterium]